MVLKFAVLKKPVLILIYQADQIKLIILKFQILIFINLLQKEFQSVEASTFHIINDLDYDWTLIQSPNNQATILGVQSEGYSVAASIKGQTYQQVPINLKGGIQLATTSGFAVNQTSAVIAGTGDITARGERNAVISSSGGSSTEGSRALIASSNNAHIRGNQASRTILSSENIILEEPYTVAGGH